MEKLITLFDSLFSENNFNHGVLSDLKITSIFQKVIIKPILLKNILFYQFQFYQKDKVIHKNLSPLESREQLLSLLNTTYRQALIKSDEKTYQIFVNKDQSVKVLTKDEKSTVQSFQHNQKKKYILSESEPLYYLIELGIMNSLGQIVKAKYDKFKQINRFLEFIDDIVDQFIDQKVIKIIDFGCGKSYLTFAIHDYLTRIKNYQVDIIGLDLKKDVIDNCNEIVLKYKLEGINFIQGDIADFESFNEIDLVVSLHACNTATDFALFKAITWKAKVILAVPCCHHELNKKIKSEKLDVLLEYGIIKERMSALMSDVIRANLLQIVGYKTQILEFIDFAHTPKNLLIRAIRQKSTSNVEKQINNIITLKNEFNSELTLEKLLKEAKILNID